MAKVNVKVLKAVVDGQGEGSTLSIDERSAKHFESLGYVQIEAEKKITKQPAQKDADEKGTSAPKKSASRKRKKQAEEN